jgi:HEAT repeat protein
MNPPLLVSLILLSAVPAAASPVAAPIALSLREDVPDKRPEVEKICEEMRAHVAKGGAEDQDAVAGVDKLLQEFKTSGPKDRAAIVAALSKNFEAKRRENEAGVRDNRIFRASAVALGQMGTDATKAITKWIGAKDHKKDMPVQIDLVHALGKTKDKAAVPDLISLLENKDAPIVGAAADALAEFADADQETRKKGFEGMLKVLMSAKGAKDSNINDGVARERYDTIASPIITSLTRLSKNDERDPDKWQNWWNKNKGKNWDEEK